ncbi:MAG: hypothetical protein EOO24_12990 [Comamonadaceae bacterium]|nr:MAG: hypothetical protein EOO24_12990 [Comamonadaceae bacterium]
MNTAIRTNIAAAALLLLPVSATLLAQPAAAQQRAVVAPSGIHAVRLNSSAGLQPGATLWLNVSGTPRAQDASVTLAEGVRVALREQSPGNYAGSYTVRRGDRIDPMRFMTARLSWGEHTVARNYTFPPAFQTIATGSPVAAAPTIERFAVSPHGRLQPGSVLRFTLTGQPRADASLDIPGVIRGVDLRETRPGVYEGSYTVRRADNLRAFDEAVATLRRGPLRTTAKLELRGNDHRPGRDHADRDPRGQRDNTPPQITALSPDNGARVDERQRTRISARVSDQGSGVDPASVRLSVDGLDVTRDTRVDDGVVSYRESLGRGRHTAELVVGDRAGNVARSSWTFQVF